MRAATAFTLAASVGSSVATIYKGFNYGSTFTDNSVKVESDFLDEFNTAKALVGTSGFTSARLYTMIQGGTTDTAISAIPAAISSETTLLLGLWASAGQADFTDEINALTAAITEYGSSFADLVVGISVGSEDLYRITPTGIENDAGVGAEPSTIVDYISQVRTAIKDTVLSSAPVGHVDTWTAWVNGSNDAVIAACDFVGMDAYPYFENTLSNSIDNGASLFLSAYDQTVSAAGSTPVWVTETGWAVSGSADENLAVASVANAKTYWDDVGCESLFGKVNTWWYTLQDAYPTTPNPSFGIVGTTLSTTPLYNLTCPGASSSSSSSASSTASSTATSASSTVSSVTTPTTGAVSATTSISEAPIPSASTSVEASGSVSASSASAESASVTGSVAPTAASGTTTSVITTASSESVVGGQTLTIYRTTLVTITSCSSSCQTTLATASATVASASSATVTASSAKSTVASSTSASSATASASSCPADISGDYQYPHLIIPVSSASPTKAYGTQYDGYINSTVSTIFNFDIPESYAGKTCSLVFLFPELSELETSSYTFNNEGGIVSYVLSSAATAETTYDNQPSKSLENGSISSLASGNSYVISSDSCPAGTTVSFELSATGGLDLEFFEDYNPSPLGLYVRAC